MVESHTRRSKSSTPTSLFVESGFREGSDKEYLYIIIQLVTDSTKNLPYIQKPGGLQYNEQILQEVTQHFSSLVQRR